MAALCNTVGHYILHCGFFYLLFFFPRLISAVADWMSTILLHMVWHVALVRIENAGLKYAARGSLEMQDPKNGQKFAIWSPSRNFVGLYLRN